MSITSPSEHCDYTCPTQWLQCEQKRECTNFSLDSSAASRFDCPSREIVRYYHLYECSCWCSCHHQNSRVLIKRPTDSLSTAATHAQGLPAILAVLCTVHCSLFTVHCSDQRHTRNEITHKRQVYSDAGFECTMHLIQSTVRERKREERAQRTQQ